MKDVGVCEFDHSCSVLALCPQLDDMTVTMESQRGQISQLDKKQKKFDTVRIDVFG